MALPESPRHPAAPAALLVMLATYNEMRGKPLQMQKLSGIDDNDDDDDDDDDGKESEEKHGA